MTALIALCVTTLLSLQIAGSPGDGQKPVKKTFQHGDGGMGAPPTLEELWKATPLIVDGTIRKSRPADQVLKGSSDGDFTIVRSAHEVEISEIFRDTRGVGAPTYKIELLQRGGDRDRGAYIDSVEDETFKRFNAGERYLLFLKPARDGSGLFVAATDTADSAYLLAEDGSVHARGGSPLAKELERKPEVELLNLLRRMKERE